jgi:RES domain-containing protein
MIPVMALTASSGKGSILKGAAWNKRTNVVIYREKSTV